MNSSEELTIVFQNSILDCKSTLQVKEVLLI